MVKKGELNGRYIENSALCLQLVCKFKIIQNKKNYIKKTFIDFNLVFCCLFSPCFSTHTLSKVSVDEKCHYFTPFSYVYSDMASMLPTSSKLFLSRWSMTSQC